MLRVTAFLIGMSVSLAADAEPQVLRLHGSNTVGAELAPALVDSWLRARGWTELKNVETKLDERVITAQRGGAQVRVEIHAHGTATGFADLAAESTDFAMASRPVTAKELASAQQMASLDSAQQEHVLALDGLALVVHPQNPLRALTMAQVKALFGGQINNWKALGGSDVPVRLYARDERSGTFDTFKSLVLGGLPLATAKRFESNRALVDSVLGDPAGIGFVGLNAVGKSKALAIADAQALAILPTAATVATEDYPLSRRLFLYHARVLSPLGREFLDYTLGDAGQNLVPAGGFVSMRIAALQLKPPTRAPEEYQRLSEGAQRLSVNFRFNNSNAILDNRALRDVKRIANFMGRPENRDATLRLAGFTDQSFEMAYSELTLSESWADLVASELNRAGVRVERVRGFGSALPVADNQSDAGRSRNRRVEVWFSRTSRGEYGSDSL